MDETITVPKKVWVDLLSAARSAQFLLRPTKRARPDIEVHVHKELTAATKAAADAEKTAGEQP